MLDIIAWIETIEKPDVSNPTAADIAFLDLFQR